MKNMGIIESAAQCSRVAMMRHYLSMAKIGRMKEERLKERNLYNILGIIAQSCCGNWLYDRKGRSQERLVWFGNIPSYILEIALVLLMKYLLYLVKLA